MNRHQNHLELLLADTKTGATKTLLEEKNKYYIDIHDNLTFLENGKEFIWTSEQDGYNHIYLYDMNGKLQRQLTKGECEVTGRLAQAPSSVRSCHGLERSSGLLPWVHQFAFQS